MKSLILLSILVILINSSFAQWSNYWINSIENKHLLYSTGSLMVGNQLGGNIGMTFVYDSKFSVQIGYSSQSDKMNAQNPLFKSAMPSDADEFVVPEKMMENFNVFVGRYLYLNAKETIRLVVQGGPGMSVMIGEVSQQPEDIENGYTKYIMQKTKGFSMILNSKFEFPVTELIGFSAGPTLIMDHEKQNLTFCIGFMYGIISRN